MTLNASVSELLKRFELIHAVESEIRKCNCCLFGVSPVMLRRGLCLVMQKSPPVVFECDDHVHVGLRKEGR